MAEVYTNPRSREMVRDYFADVDAFEARGNRAGVPLLQDAEFAPERMSRRGTPSRVARFAFAALTVVTGTIRAQEASDPHAVQPERPTVATHAGTVAPG